MQCTITYYTMSIICVLESCTVAFLKCPNCVNDERLNNLIDGTLCVIDFCPKDWFIFLC